MGDTYLGNWYLTGPAWCWHNQLATWEKIKIPYFGLPKIVSLIQIKNLNIYGWGGGIKTLKLLFYREYMNLRW